MHYRTGVSLSYALSHRKMVDKEKSKQSRRILELNCCAQYLPEFHFTGKSVFTEVSKWAQSRVKPGSRESGMTGG